MMWKNRWRNNPDHKKLPERITVMRKTTLTAARWLGINTQDLN
jgi:hypothetical protein